MPLWISFAISSAFFRYCLWLSLPWLPIIVCCSDFCKTAIRRCFATCSPPFLEISGRLCEWISRTSGITRGCIFGRVVSLRQRGENFIIRHIRDVSVDVLVLMSEIDGEGRITA